MPLLRETAELLSSESIERGMIEEIIDRDEMFALLPFMGVNGKAYVYDRENTLSGAAFLDVNENVPESAADFEECVARLRILIGDVDVDKFLDATMSDRYDQKALQVAAKAKAVARLFKQTLAAGDSTTNPKSFDGISRLCASDYTLTAGANGGAVSLSTLDELKDAVILGADAFIMRSGTWRAIKALYRASNGNTGEMLATDSFGQTVAAFDGTPVFRNDFLSPYETMGTNNNTCSIYAARFNEVDGLHGIYGGGNAGMVVEDIGTVQNRDATRTRVKWYCGLVLKSTRSLARIKGVTSV